MACGLLVSMIYIHKRFNDYEEVVWGDNRSGGKEEGSRTDPFINDLLNQLFGLGDSSWLANDSDINKITRPTLRFTFFLSRRCLDVLYTALLLEFGDYSTLSTDDLACAT